MDMRNKNNKGMASMAKGNRELSLEQHEELLEALKARFKKIWTAMKELNGLRYKPG